MERFVFRRPTQQYLPRFGNNLRIYAPPPFSIIEMRERELIHLLESQLPQTPEHRPTVRTIPNAPRKKRSLRFEDTRSLRQVPFDIYKDIVIFDDPIQPSFFDDQLSLSSVDDIFCISNFNSENILEKEERPLTTASSVKESSGSCKNVHEEIKLLHRQPHPLSPSLEKPAPVPPGLSPENPDLVFEFLNEDVDTEINETDEAFEVKEMKAFLTCIGCGAGMCFVEWEPLEKASRATVQKYKRMGYKFTASPQKNGSRIMFTIHWKPTWESAATISKTMNESIQDCITAKTCFAVSQKPHLKILGKICKCSLFVKNTNNWKLY